MQAYVDEVVLTESGRPVLLGPPAFDQEVELLTENEVTWCFGNEKVYRHGTLRVTSHRLIWDKGDIRKSMSIGQIREVEASSVLNVFATPKVTIWLLPRVLPADPKQHGEGPVTLPVPAPGYMKFHFHERNHDDFMGKLQQARKMRSWCPLQQGSTRALDSFNRKGFTTSAAGINGIIRDVNRTHVEHNRTMSEAFQDLDALMAKAKDMVLLAERFSNSEENKLDQGGDEFRALLHNLGIPSPVTKESAGAAYHVELSRQLVDFLIPYLQKHGGVMMLIDVYCLFNRARGTELISPDDLVHACRLFEHLRLPMKLRRYPSGVIVIQSGEHDDSSMSKRILGLIKKFGPITPLELSQEMQISITLAQQYLVTAELSEYLCRDESLEALRFYPNIFAQAI